MQERIFINKNIWKEFSEKEMEDYIDLVFNHYRQYGFPFFPSNSDYRLNEFIKLQNYVDKNNVFDEDSNSFKQTMHGLGLCWSYFPHSFSVNCNNKLSPIEAFNNDEIFKKVIKKRIQIGDNISDNGIRKMLKIYTNVQSVSNFRPTAACSIYKYFSKVLNNKELNVWDMSGGYGGRLFGAISSKVVSNYIATEPCEKTYKGLINICHDFKGEWVDNIYMLGSECFVAPKKDIDVCFTSPPYFDCEKYSNEDTQSYIKYKTKDLWLEGFLSKTIDNCYDSLKDGGYLALNIANVPSFKTFENDFLQIMCRKDMWEFDKTLYLSLSSLNKNKKFKYEPIFIFKKR